jgi:hypothetical protein
MPQNATQVLVGLNSGAPKALAVDASGNLILANKAVTPTVVTGTIATTNTFQACLAANADRLPGGTITNNGAALMQVFFGATGSASADKAVDLAAGATLYLAQVFGPNQVYTGAIAITGTATQT